MAIIAQLRKRNKQKFYFSQTRGFHDKAAPLPDLLASYQAGTRLPCPRFETGAQEWPTMTPPLGTVPGRYQSVLVTPSE